MKKSYYVASTVVYLQDSRGNAKVLEPGTEITEREFKALNAPRQAKFTRVEKEVGKPRVAKMLHSDLPVFNGVAQTAFASGEFHLLKGETRDLAEECAQLWAVAYPEIPFPGVNIGRYNGGERHLTFFLSGEGIPENLPPMYSTSNKLCKRMPKKHVVEGAYPYTTASLIKVTERLRSGRPVFAYSEAIDTLLTEILA